MDHDGRGPIQVAKVRVDGHRLDVRRLDQVAWQMQDRFHFVEGPTRGDFHLHITTEPGNALFSVDRTTGVTVSTWQGRGIAYYAGLDLDTYCVICALLGLVQLRALNDNPSLVPEDFLHGEPQHCLFTTLPTKQEYALLLDDPKVCHGCLSFFRCLGAEPEVGALAQALDSVAQRKGGRVRPKPN